MSGLEPELVELAEAYGVATEYWDWQGRHVEVPRDTVVRVLRALDVDASTPDAARAARDRLEHQRWEQALPPYVATRAKQPANVTVHVPHGDPATVWVELEDGSRREDVAQLHHLVEPRQLDDVLMGEARFRLPADLPTGYHQVCVATEDGGEVRTPLTVTPAQLEPSALGDGRVWGFAVQLYSLRSHHSWGLGDLSDLGDLAAWSASALGAGFLLANPLFAGDPVPPIEPSPYLPTTRRFFNPLYARVEAIPELESADADVHARVEALAEPVRGRNRSPDLLDRDAVWIAKLTALDLARRLPRGPARDAEYRAFREREGQALQDFATWCVLAEVYGTRWEEWPAVLRDPRSPEVARVREDHADRVDLHCYAQWQLEAQLEEAQRRARDAGMPFGIIHDLPVGVHPDGADAWALQDVLAAGINVGAPPDAFNQQGQDWSQPPWRPDRLAATSYAAWRDLVRRVLRHGGGLRVDHVIGLFRLWWVPEGSAPTAGTYVRYDHEALLGILALETERAGAVLVGEDLGTVEPWVRDVLRERGVLGTSVAWFEYTDDGQLRPPEQWRRLCLATVTVHDLPPSGAYLEGAHIRLRDELGLLTRPADEEWAALARERSLWRATLTERGHLSPEAESDPRAVVEAMHRYVSDSPALLVGVALTDAVGDRRTQNQPGTHREYPNWQLPLCDGAGHPVLLEDLPRRADLPRLVETLRQDRHGAG